MRSPLRYPGGKTRACGKLHEVLQCIVNPSEIDTVVSPFFGGGSFEFFLMNTYGLNVIGNDLFFPLYLFWSTIQHVDNRTQVCRMLRLECSQGVSKDRFYECRGAIQQRLREGNNYVDVNNDVDVDSSCTNIHQAAFYYILNRCSFSGSTLSGGYSPHAAKERFTTSSVDRLERLSFLAEKFVITNVDAFDMLEPYIDQDHSHAMRVTRDQRILFLDPPYWMSKRRSKLYGQNGDLHIHFDHERLFYMLSRIRSIPWMLTYNDCDEVRIMYKDYVIIPLTWAYGMNKSKMSSEIVICNRDIHKITNISEVN